MTALTLADFLRARLDEDDAVARAAAARPIRARGQYSDLMGLPPEQTDVSAVSVSWYRASTGWGPGDHGTWPAGTEHFRRFDPAYVLADVEAKRRIVDLHTGEHECPRDGDNCGYWHEDEACTTLRLLALPYAEHPDYRQEWKP